MIECGCNNKPVEIPRGFPLEITIGSTIGTNYRAVLTQHGSRRRGGVTSIHDKSTGKFTWSAEKTLELKSRMAYDLEIWEAENGNKHMSKKKFARAVDTYCGNYEEPFSACNPLNEYANIDDAKRISATRNTYGDEAHDGVNYKAFNCPGIPYFVYVAASSGDELYDRDIAYRKTALGEFEKIGIYRVIFSEVEYVTADGRVEKITRSPENDDNRADVQYLAYTSEDTGSLAFVRVYNEPPKDGDSVYIKFGAYEYRRVGTYSKVIESTNYIDIDIKFSRTVLTFVQKGKNYVEYTSADIDYTIFVRPTGEDGMPTIGDVAYKYIGDNTYRPIGTYFKEYSYVEWAVLNNHESVDDVVVEDDTDHTEEEDGVTRLVINA